MMIEQLSFCHCEICERLNLELLFSNFCALCKPLHVYPMHCGDHDSDSHSNHVVNLCNTKSVNLCGKRARFVGNHYIMRRPDLETRATQTTAMNDVITNMDLIQFQDCFISKRELLSSGQTLIGFFTKDYFRIFKVWFLHWIGPPQNSLKYRTKIMLYSGHVMIYSPHITRLHLWHRCNRVIVPVPVPHEYW